MKPFGRYILDDRIARGGMAEVYRARLRGGDGFEKVMCIKCILPHLARMQAFGAMFRDEASIAAHLQHQNVVQVFDYGEVDGTLFIAMEYVDGVSLARILAAREQLHVAAVLKIGIDVCKGLHHAHTATRDGRALGIVHRDVSPQNILLTRQGDVKVTDFGVARAEGRRTHTASGVVKGKVQYMAPEQIVGHAFDHRVDQFACGIVLWEALTGQPLFRGATDYVVLDAITRVPVQPPSSVRPEIPPSVDAAILRALAKNADERFADMEAFGDALMSCMSQMPVFPGDVPGPAALDLVPVITRVMAKAPVREKVTDDDDEAGTVVTPDAEGHFGDANDSDVSTGLFPSRDDATQLGADVEMATRVDRAGGVRAQHPQAIAPANAPPYRSPALFARALVISVVVAAVIGAAWFAWSLGSDRRVRPAAGMQCPSGYVAVAGERDVAPFCVAAFEMKSAPELPGGIAPRADGVPIQNVTRTTAIDLCRGLGAGFHLIDNNEWQALAHDIERVDANWTGGVVGSGVLVTGNTGVNAGAAIASDPCATPGSATRFPRCDDRTSTDFIHRRTHQLSSGGVVWDVGSNASEWTASDTSAEIPHDVRAAACLATGVAREAYGPVGNYECGTAPNPFMFGCLEGSGGTVVVRGGSSAFEGTPWDSCLGVFYVNTNGYWDATTKTGHGFRCAWSPPASIAE